MAQDLKEASIIEVIRDMVKQGASEEQIVQNLRELGVEPEKAKRLLLLGEADTFALLRNEISKIAEEDVSREIPKLHIELEKKSAESKAELKQALALEFSQDIGRIKNSLISENKDFRDGIAEDVSKALKNTEKFQGNLEQLNIRMQQLNADIDEARLSGTGARNKMLSIAMIFAGMIFLAAALYLIFFKFLSEPTIDNMVFAIVTAIIGITLLFVSTIT